MSFPAMVTGIITSMSEWPKGSPLNIIYILINSLIIFGLFLLMQRNPYLVQYGSLPVRNRDKGNTGKSHLANVDIINLKHNLEIIMEDEKLYCDEDLSLSRLSEALEVTTHQLSQFLNEHHNKNFNCYINNYRIRDAKNMLIDDPKRSTLSIAYAVGFNSYSSFYTVFKKEVNLSPVEYRKKNSKQ
jgi:AraC-like DNA-binding protein